MAPWPHSLGGRAEPTPLVMVTELRVPMRSAAFFRITTQHACEAGWGTVGSGNVAVVG